MVYLVGYINTWRKWQDHKLKYSHRLCLGAAIEQWIYLIEHHSYNGDQIFGPDPNHNPTSTMENILLKP